jgi:hypothetical protein
MIEQLSGALTFAYFVAAIYFLRFWRRTSDPLFVHFAVAFGLFALNQLTLSVPVVSNETDGYEYLLRASGFILILIAIVQRTMRGVSR